MNKYLLALVLSFVVFFSLSAQHSGMKNGVFFKRVFADYQTPEGGSFFNFKSYRPAWEMGYNRQLFPHLNLSIPIRAGVYSVNSENSVNRPYFGADLLLQYYFGGDKHVILPFVFGGVGGHRAYDGSLNIQAPVGAGLFIRMYDGAYFTADASYRFGTKKSNLQYGVGFVYSLNKLVEKMKISDTGKRSMDSDGDGIIDELDLCPSIAGLEKFMGCPDSDEDGIEDSKDKCPDVAGPKSLMGCPDSDGDGVADVEDTCPNLKGVASNHGGPETAADSDKAGVPDDKDKCPDVAGSSSTMGCPDTDGDGIADYEDNCPNLKGVASNHGCPGVLDSDGDGVSDSEDNCPNIKGLASNHGCPGIADSDGDGIEDSKDKCPNQVGVIQFSGCPDSDGDGIPDSEDYCPNTRGPKSTHGCPEIKKEDRDVLDIAMRAVQFETGKATLKYSSFTILDKIAEIMRKYRDYNLIISGHTDNTGRAVINQRLSERRAKACYEYLINKGVAPSRMRYAGYGESRPIADNLTAQGRALNRRVEFKLVPSRR